MIVPCFVGLKKASEIFQSFGIGIGALFGGLAGLTAFIDWLDKRKRREGYIKELRNKYPRSLLNKEFRLIQKQSMQGWLFLLDDKKKIKFWIKDSQALKDLNYSFADAIVISDEEFDDYPQGDAIVAMRDFD